MKTIEMQSNIPPINVGAFHKLLFILGIFSRLQLKYIMYFVEKFITFLIPPIYIFQFHRQILVYH